MNKITGYKTFKVIASSENTNSFGLRGLVVVAYDGEAWELGANNLNAKKQGEFIKQTIEFDNDTGKVLNSYFKGYEIPKQLEKCPSEVVKEIYNEVVVQ